MSRRLDVLNIGDPEQRAKPAMPSACETGGCGGGPEPLIPPPPAYGDVVVNGVEITAEDIAAEIQHHPAPDAETAWLEAARALAVRELLLQEAERLQIEAEPEIDESGREETTDDALVRAVLEQQVRSASPGEEECRRYYDAHMDRFRTPDLFEAAHILIEPEGPSDEDWAAAEQSVRAIAAQIGNDPVKFGAAARAHSKCASAQQDGSLGQIRRGELVPTIQQGLEALQPGETGTEPVKSRFGWHLLRLHRRVDGRTLPFEMARPPIADMLEARSWSIEAARYVGELARRGNVQGVQIDGVAN